MDLIGKIEALCSRLEKAREIVAEGGVQRLAPGVYLVTSNGRAHKVIRGRCDCEDSRYRPELAGLCKHRLAVELYLRQFPGTSAQTSPCTSVPPSPTHTPNAPATVTAQSGSHPDQPGVPSCPGGRAAAGVRLPRRSVESECLEQK